MSKKNEKIIHFKSNKQSHDLMIRQFFQNQIPDKIHASDSLIVKKKIRFLLIFFKTSLQVMLPFYPMYNMGYYHPVWYVPVNQSVPNNRSIEEELPQLPIEEENQEGEFEQKIKKALRASDIYTKKKHWEKEEDNLLKKFYQKENMTWKEISEQIPGTNDRICERRYKRIVQKQKNWLSQQEEKIRYLREIENKKWKEISEHIPNRSSKQIRERYINFLRSDIVNKCWQLEEDVKIMKSLCCNGKKWKILEKQLEGRSENQIKNRYYGTLIFIERKVKKKMRQEKNRKKKRMKKQDFH